jgi:hypothetical protein
MGLWQSNDASRRRRFIHFDGMIPASELLFTTLAAFGGLDHGAA